MLLAYFRNLRQFHELQSKLQFLRKFLAIVILEMIKIVLGSAEYSISNIHFICSQNYDMGFISQNCRRRRTVGGCFLSKLFRKQFLRQCTYACPNIFCIHNKIYLCLLYIISQNPPIPNL